MADEGQLIHGIIWRRTLPFTHIFRSFRIAIHMSKLILGLALLLSVYFGGRILDWCWPARAQAAYLELSEYEQIANGNDKITLGEWREQTLNATEQAYAQKLIDYQIITPNSGETPDATMNRALEEARGRHYLSDLHEKILKQRDDQVAKINKDYDAARAAAQSQYAKDNNKKALDDANDAATKIRKQAVLDTYDAALAEWNNDQLIRGQGLFDCFFQYEIRQVTGVVFEGVLKNNWLEAGGVKDRVYNFFAVGPVWLIWNHPVFFVVFAILFLLAWALFGGAISRIAAIHVARDEKISVRQAMNFAVGKLLSFASAPVIPLVIVIVIGLIVSVVALVGNLPFFGPIIIGVFFFLALLAGFVMTLVLLGTAGGFNLMYPTIAVEGSDSFDAISRSFSYVYARPWRMLFYTIVALIYGAATYLFVHMFIWTALVLTHHFVGLGILNSSDNTRPLMSVMWPDPATTGRLSYTPQFDALGPGQELGARFMNAWVMLMVAFLGAYAISLYFSANTIIYYLMRAEVDVTEMDDVYLEQSEEELDLIPGDPAAPPGSPGETSSERPGAEETPPPSPATT